MSQNSATFKAGSNVFAGCGMSIPERALSIRQPWAWAIFNGKDVENRSWQAVHHGLDETGRFAIHASKGITRDEYENASRFMESLDVACPPAAELKRGGIIGTAELVDVVRESDSPWFFGPRGLVLRNAEPCDFIPCAGSLGFFKWERDDSIVVKPAKWMLTDLEREEFLEREAPQDDLPLFGDLS